MRVVCVNNAPLKNKQGEMWATPELIEGDVYSATQCDLLVDCYEIEGHLYCPVDGTRCSYQKVRFVPLSEIDEMEMINEKQCVNNQ